MFSIILRHPLCSTSYTVTNMATNSFHTKTANGYLNILAITFNINALRNHINDVFGFPFLTRVFFGQKISCIS